ncbi:phosphoglycerate dehydrogenase [Desulfovibrio litoralis]|uniref:D-3-phosphoglycerate dehydrogenase n=1 Tax=Desulfovibrio litoralis DSM 11393 TaxID=1121455 RepID=A0A1M7S651_9BACT|nr:phosphoglycerate dehydrogenase [Desulfovibrio litoralis]SHN53910.1 D-3-phosphoglycerate dehydrogenase [Desulfovibrio litoralis DSM 11393]
MQVGITTSSFAQYDNKPLELLKNNNLKIVLNPHGRELSEDEAIELLKDCVGVAAGTEPLNARVLEALPKLKVISRCGVGMDSVDIKKAEQLGIVVKSTPDAPTRAVVELTLGLALDLFRQVSFMDRELRAGVWKKRMGSLLEGKKLGIIGYGRIGRAVGAAFKPLGVEVAFYDPFVKDDSSYKELNALLAWSDIITLHCSKGKSGVPVLGVNEFKHIKTGAYIINCARGGLIDEVELCKQLKDGKISGAALDVYSSEPYKGPLTELNNVILLPHVGSYAKETRINMENQTINNLISGLKEQGLL